MKELELLGLQPDGEHLTLNDAEGNRYQLAITNDLRAALRRDLTSTPDEAGEPRVMTPREIQSYIREGRTVEEVSEMASLPPSRIDVLAHPIFEERRYAMQRARALPTGRDTGAMTLEELATTRLATRDVAPADIEWDALRRKGEPWTLLARYTTAERERTATWHVDLQSRTFDALDEEAIWLSETPLLPGTTTWRAPNTPPLDMPAPTPDLPAPLQRPATPPSPPAPATPEAAGEAAPSRIDAVLASLDSQRGVASSMPLGEDFDELALSEASAAEVLTMPTPSIDSAPSPAATSADSASEMSVAEAASEETEAMFDLPMRPVTVDTPVEEAAPATDEDALLPAPETEPVKKTRKSNRPSVPTWDEIVFGKKD